MAGNKTQASLRNNPFEAAIRARRERVPKRRRLRASGRRGAGVHKGARARGGEGHALCG